MLFSYRFDYFPTVLICFFLFSECDNELSPHQDGENMFPHKRPFYFVTHHERSGSRATEPAEFMNASF